MFEKVEPQVDFVKLEHDVLAFWRERDVFNQRRKLNAGKPIWSFLDGPITANNPMGVHHAWGRTYKDLFQRYFAMKGFDQRYQNGFDCQGLWVEVEVEKALGFTTKKDIEEYGLEKFVEMCKERVRKFSAIQTEQSIRLGYWMDWDNSYFTMTDENNYTIWGFLKRCHERGLIYKGTDSMPWCPRCGTGISQHEMHEGYREVVDRSVIVRLPLRDRTDEYILAWTTTPWTLTANVACAVHPEITYAKVKQDGLIYYLAEACLDQMKSNGPFEVLHKLPGAQMVGWKYAGPFDELPAQKDVAPLHRVVGWKDVSAEEGTGIVHVAPGCGREDFELSKTEKLACLVPIDEAGVYVEGYGDLVGKPAQKVADEILKSLRAKGVYYKSENYKHNYPHCWRCGTALLFRNVHEWFINMNWREEIMESAREVRWIPDWGLDRELDWLANMRDWMISKKRYWGLALPIWECECGHFEIIGSREELKARAVAGWDAFEGNSPHRPWIDAVKITCSECGRQISRIKDVGNPWLDAGIVPYSTVGYNSDRDYWSKWIPADLVTECFPGQFRNWVYALLAMSTMMERKAPFKTLFGYALMRDEHGKEMHKSAGNAIWFDDAAEKMGVDVMRWIFCAHNPLNNLNFGWTLGDQIKRKVFSTLWNVYAFFSNYARLDAFDPKAPQVPLGKRQDIDRWLLSDLQLLVREANTDIPNYELYPFMRKAERFIEDLSNWYVRRNRRRFWRTQSEDDTDKLAAYQTLYETLVTLCKVLAPVIPFVTEIMYRQLVAQQDPAAPESVHLCDYPEARLHEIDETLSAQMDTTVDVVSTALSLRTTTQLRVRQPLRELKVFTADETARTGLKRFERLVLEELNVKSLTVAADVGAFLKHSVRCNMKLVGPKYGPKAPRIQQTLVAMDPLEVAAKVREGAAVEVQLGDERFELAPEEVEVTATGPEHFVVAGDSRITVALDTEVTEDLRLEGLARDVVRHVQQLRKDLDLNMEDRIELSLKTDDEELTHAITTWHDYITAETLCVKLSDTLEAPSQKTVRVGKGDLELWLKRREA